MQLKNSLVGLMFLFVAVIFGAGFVYEKNNERGIQMTQEQSSVTEGGAPSVSETQKKKCDPSDSDNWETFDSELINFSFRHPSCSAFEERTVTSGVFSSPEMKNTFFQDTNYDETDGNGFGFDVYTNRDQILNGVRFEELARGEKLWKLNVSPFMDKYTVVKQKAPGMYQVTGFSDMECSPGIQSILLVAPPKKSDLKVIYFFLGTDSAPLTELDNYCVDENPDKVAIDRAIRRNINGIVNEEEPQINKRLNFAIQIAKTFQTR